VEGKKKKRRTLKILDEEEGKTLSNERCKKGRGAQLRVIKEEKEKKKKKEERKEQKKKLREEKRGRQRVVQLIRAGEKAGAGPAFAGKKKKKEGREKMAVHAKKKKKKRRTNSFRSEGLTRLVCGERERGKEGWVPRLPRYREGGGGLKCRSPST